MLKKVRVEDNGDSKLLPGSLVDINELEEINKALEAEGKNQLLVREFYLVLLKLL